MDIMYPNNSNWGRLYIKRFVHTHTHTHTHSVSLHLCKVDTGIVNDDEQDYDDDDDDNKKYGELLLIFSSEFVFQYYFWNRKY